MKTLYTCAVLLLASQPVFAAAATPTVGAPTLGEGALLALCVALPAAGAFALRRRFRSRD